MMSILSAFLLTSFSLAELDNGYQIFFDMYLLALGWRESAVIFAGILRGGVESCFKGIVGDIIDKTTWDRRNMLAIASTIVAATSFMVFFVKGSEPVDKMTVYIVDTIESAAHAFLEPAFAAITLSAFGPELFDEMQVKKELVAHAGAIISGILSSVVAWVMYPSIELVFLLPAAFAICVVLFVRFIPKGDPLMGRGFHLHTQQRDEQGCVIADDQSVAKDFKTEKASSYRDVFFDKRILAIILADVFHVIAEANVGLIFSETLADVGSHTMDNGHENDHNKDDHQHDRDLDYYYYDSAYSYYNATNTTEYTTFEVYEQLNGYIMSRRAIPLLATATTLSRIVMIGGTYLVGYLTTRGYGRKPFYVLHLCFHSIRVISLLLCFYNDAGKAWLISTEMVGGLALAFGLVNQFMRADILFGSGRFNVVDGFQATIRGIAATSSQYVGGFILEKNGPMTALIICLAFSVIPPIIGILFVPETLGMRERDFKKEKELEKLNRRTLLEITCDGYEMHEMSVVWGCATPGIAEATPYRKLV